MFARETKRNKIFYLLRKNVNFVQEIFPDDKNSIKNYANIK